MQRIREFLGLSDPEAYAEAEKVADRAIAKKRRERARRLAETVPPEAEKPSPGGVDPTPSPW